MKRKLILVVLGILTAGTIMAILFLLNSPDAGGWLDFASIPMIVGGFIGGLFADLRRKENIVARLSFAILGTIIGFLANYLFFTIFPIG